MLLGFAHAGGVPGALGANVLWHTLRYAFVVVDDLCTIHLGPSQSDGYSQAIARASLALPKR